MQLRQLSAASVVLAAMSVMAEGAWADVRPAAPGHRAAREPGRAPGEHSHAGRPAPALAAAAALPPTLDLRGESRFEPAPTPNDATAPPSRSSSEATAEPHMFAVKTQFRGDGYPYGATPQGLDNRNDPTVPGFDLTLPLTERPGEGMR